MGNFFKPTKSKKEQGPKQFSLKTLSSATEFFHAQTKLGKGGFAQAYKGKLNDKREIAVKKPLLISEKGTKLVLNEMKLLYFYGYLAPEYNCGDISSKADAYSFGVVLLELISGQKNWLFHDRSSNGQDLRDRANQLYKEGRVSEFINRKLIPSVVLDQVQLCVHIGIMCTEYDPELRPTLGRVYSMLSENHSSSSTLVEEPMRDGSSSASSTARNSDESNSHISSI